MGYYLINYFILAIFAIASGSEDLNHQIFSANHFRDLAFEFSTEENDWVTTKPTLLIMFEWKCKNEKYLEKFQMENIHMPSPKVLNYLQYDYGAFPRQIWHSTSEEAMEGTFSVSRCPTAVFFKSGSSKFAYTLWHSTMGKTSFSQWFWNLMKVDIFVSSQHKDQLVVSFEGPGPEIKPVIYNNGEERNLIVYVGYNLIITFRGTNNIVHAQMIDWDTPKEKIIIKLNAEPIANTAEWKEKDSHDQHDYLHKIHEYERELRTMYIKTFKQPLLLGHISESGFKNVEINDAFYQKVKSIWTYEKLEKPKNETRIVKANISQIEPWLVSCGKREVLQMPVQGQSQENVVKRLKQEVEDWLRIETELIEIQDIFVYPEGSHIRPHVSRADEVIIAMMILEVEENDSEIFLEYRNYKTGVADLIKLKEETILMYESSTLVTSLIEPLKEEQAIVAINAVFKPKYGWHWNVLADNVTVQMGSNLEMIEHMDHYHQRILTGRMPEKLDGATFTEEHDFIVKAEEKRQIKSKPVKANVQNVNEKIDTEHKDETMPEEGKLKVLVPDTVVKKSSETNGKELGHHDEL